MLRVTHVIQKSKAEFWTMSVAVVPSCFVDDCLTTPPHAVDQPSFGLERNVKKFLRSLWLLTSPRQRTLQPRWVPEVLYSGLIRGSGRPIEHPDVVLPQEVKVTLTVRGMALSCCRTSALP